MQRCNNIGIKGSRAFVKALESNTTLLEFIITNYQISPEIINRLQKIQENKNKLSLSKTVAKNIKLNNLNVNYFELSQNVFSKLEEPRFCCY